jgi:hypothetical protein
VRQRRSKRPCSSTPPGPARVAAARSPPPGACCMSRVVRASFARRLRRRHLSQRVLRRGEDQRGRARHVARVDLCARARRPARNYSVITA